MISHLQTVSVLLYISDNCFFARGMFFMVRCPTVSSVKVHAAIDQMLCYWPLVVQVRNKTAVSQVQICYVSPLCCAVAKM